MTEPIAGLKGGKGERKGNGKRGGKREGGLGWEGTGRDWKENKRDEEGEGRKGKGKREEERLGHSGSF